MLIQNSFPPTLDFWPAAPPDSPPEANGPRTLVVEPIKYVRYLFDRLHHADAEIHINLAKWELTIDFFNSTFHHCCARVSVFKNCAELQRSSGDGVAYLHLLKYRGGGELTPKPPDPLMWKDSDVNDIIETSMSPGGGLSMILRYSMFPEGSFPLAKYATKLLQEKIDVSLLAARVLRELAQRGKLFAGLGPDISRALIGAGPLVSRELVASLRAISG